MVLFPIVYDLAMETTYYISPADEERPFIPVWTMNTRTVEMYLHAGRGEMNKCCDNTSRLLRGGAPRLLLRCDVVLRGRGGRALVLMFQHRQFLSHRVRG
jgi:hypothetical protein